MLKFLASKIQNFDACWMPNSFASKFQNFEACWMPNFFDSKIQNFRPNLDAQFFAFEIQCFWRMFDTHFFAFEIHHFWRKLMPNFSLSKSVGDPLARAPTNLFTEYSPLTYPTVILERSGKNKPNLTMVQRRQNIFKFTLTMSHSNQSETFKSLKAFRETASNV